MSTRISTLEIDGKRYAVVPFEVLEREAPQLLA